jgi:hypothetical protein
MDAAESVPISTLEDALAFGLAVPPRAFVIHLTSSRPEFSHAWLGFTRDNQLVIGVSVDDADDESPGAFIAAERALQELVERFDCHLGLAGVELPAPLSEQACARARSAVFVTYQRSRGMRKVRSRPTLPVPLAYAVALVAGAALWIATSAASGRREAWDSTLYWTLAYPAAIAAAAVLAYLAPDRPWRWALALMWAQAATLAISTSSLGLLPLGLILFGVLAVPPLGAALAVSAWARR